MDMVNKVERLSDIYKKAQEKIDKFCSLESAKFTKFLMNKNNRYGNFKEVENALKERDILKSELALKDDEIARLKSELERLNQNRFSSQNDSDWSENQPSFGYQNELKSSPIARTIDY